MPPVSGTAATSGEGDSSHVAGSQRPSAVVASLPPPSTARQSTISELFTPTLAKSSFALSDPSPNKKRKSSHQLSDTMPKPSVSSAPRRPEASSRAKADANVIDLTRSPGDTASSSSSQNTGSDARPSKFTPYTGAKRLVIKNLRQTPRTSPDEFLQRTWNQLDAALTAIFAGVRIETSLEELYRGVENTCRYKAAPELARKLDLRCRKHVTESILAPLTQMMAVGCDNVSALRAIHAAWRKWKEQLLTIRKIFYYMDRSYLLHSTTEHTIDGMGKRLFRKYVFSESKLKPSILRAICDLFDAHRNGQHDTEPALLKECIKMLHDLTVYTSDFEPAYLRSSAHYFYRWADEQSATQDLAGYIEQCGKLMQGEIERCKIFGLEYSTDRELAVMLDDILVRGKIDLLANEREVWRIFDDHSLGVLKLFYSLLHRIELLSKLERPWESYIKAAGASVINDEKREGEMVVRLLVLKAKVDSIWKSAFGKNQALGDIIRESFSFFINQRPAGSAAGDISNAKPAEMIAKHIDRLLRDGLRAITAVLGSVGETGDASAPGDVDAQLDRELDRVLELFRFIEGKAVFEAFYKKDLARRLLLGRSASADAEQNMLTRLKNECGSAFTHNLERMFKDVKLSEEMMATYKQYLAERRESEGNDASGKEMAAGHSSSNDLDLYVTVLSSADWPTYLPVEVIVPEDMDRALQAYNQYYTSKHPRRGLQWRHQLGHCVVRARFKSGVKELIVSAFQAFVLLVFNGRKDNEHLGYAEIQASTGLSDAELQRTLQSLACAKYRVLLKEPRGRDVGRHDRFTVNAAFADPLFRIKINQIQLKETHEENRATHAAVVRDRQYETQAAIVRVMKSRKVITAPELVAETINLTKARGALEPAEITQQIEKLIEKEFIEQLEDGVRVIYKYQA